MGSRWILYWLGLCVFVTAAPAEEIHVSPEPGTGGARRVASIQAALRFAGPGDTIVLHSGVYREAELRLFRGGEPDKPLTITAAPDAEVVITGSVPVTRWTRAGEHLWRRADWRTDSQQLFVDGRPLKQIAASNPFTAADAGDGSKALPRNGSSIADLKPRSFLYDAANKELICRLEDDADLNQHLVEASVARFIMDGGDFSHVILRGITFRHSNGTAQGDRSALLRVNGNGWLIEGCTFAMGDFAGLALSGAGHTVRRSVIRKNGCVGIDLNGSDAAHGHERYDSRARQEIVFEDLSVTGNNYRGFYEHWHAGGMKFVPGVRGVTVRRCTVTDNFGPGIWFDAALGSNFVTDNVVARNGAGISIEISRPAPGDEQSVVVRNNRVAFNRHQGIYVTATDRALVTRNTLHRNRWDLVLHGMPRAGATLRENVVKDNILQGELADMIVYVGEGASANVVDGNVYARGEGKLRFGAVTARGYDAAFRDLASLRARFPDFEPNGASVTMQWPRSEELDFQPAPGSAHIPDKGWTPPAPP